MSEGNMDLGNGWTTEKLRDEILEHIWIDETGDMGGVHCMHCLGYEQGEIDRAINTVFDAALRRAKAEGLEALNAVMESWVNGRKVKDGIPLTVRQQAERFLRAAQIEEGE